MKSLIGLIKWFDSDRGFGLIQEPSGDEYFLHVSNSRIPAKEIEAGNPVVFEEHRNPSKNRNEARNCRFPSGRLDWELILSYLGKKDGIEIVLQKGGKGEIGKFYKYKERQTIPAKHQAVVYILKGKAEEDFLNWVLGYFDKVLDPYLFVDYCTLIEGAMKVLFGDDCNRVMVIIYEHFAAHANPEMVFQTWKADQKRFLGIKKDEELVIGEETLRMFKERIGIKELERILTFPFGPSLCDELATSKITLGLSQSLEQVRDVLPLLEFVLERNRINFQELIDEALRMKTETAILERASSLGVIRNNIDLQKYQQLRSFFPLECTAESIAKLDTFVSSLIFRNTDESFYTELWLNDLADEPAGEIIVKSFSDLDCSDSFRMKVLDKLSHQKQLSMLAGFANANGIKNALVLFREFINGRNPYVGNSRFLRAMNSVDLASGMRGAELLLSFKGLVNSITTDEEKFALFFEELGPVPPVDTILLRSKSLGRTQLQLLVEYLGGQIDIANILAKVTLETDLFLGEECYRLAKQKLDTEHFRQFDEAVFVGMSQEDYFEYWCLGLGKFLPSGHLEEMLQKGPDIFEKFERWVERGVNKTQLSDFLFSVLDPNELIEDKWSFQSKLTHIGTLIRIDNSNLGRIESVGNNLFDVFVWFLGYRSKFDFDTLKSKFIYFNPEEQVRVVRKLFWHKARNEFDLTIERLNELVRIDLDLMLVSQDSNPSIPLDISTDVIVKVLTRFKNTGKFLIESELLTYILNALKFAPQERFQLSHYFEKCKGRAVYEFDFDSVKNSRLITKVALGDGRYLFSIWFTYDPELVEEVKKLPGRNWNPEKKAWSVAFEYEARVLEFGKKHRFKFDIGPNLYANNFHLGKLVRKAKPDSVDYCEGRKSNIDHYQLKQPFWYCGGQHCFQKCETIHGENEWEQYTLLDFLEILGINTDEVNLVGDHVSKGHYYQFIALINRFNRLLQRLNCHTCNHIMFPAGTSHFAAHTVVRFCCENETCSERKKEVYLNHCLNGSCGNFIDSRISKRCPNGLFICDMCGSCCSHSMMKRRLESLSIKGGQINSHLVDAVDHKLGHLERAEYFCFRCSGRMVEKDLEVFECVSCQVVYETGKYALKRPHRHLVP